MIRRVYFDGYCPESLLKGERVEMRLNTDDFWESEATGLQVSVFPPYATILPWRGQGKFRESSEVASNTLSGLVMTKGKKETGKEFLPDEKAVLYDDFDLEAYLSTVYKSKEEFEADRFNPNDPVFEAQQRYLESLSVQTLSKVIQLYEEVKAVDNGRNAFIVGEKFQDLNILMYDLKLIFSFNWITWHTGREHISDTNFDYSACSLVELSMYLTAIFRSDRFCSGTILYYFRNGVLDKIFNSLNRFNI